MFRFSLTAVAFATSLAAAPVSAKVVETKSDSFTTHDEAVVKAPPLATWLALIKPADWWNPKHSWSGDAKNLTLTPQAGGCFCERIPVGDSAVASALEGSARHAVVVQAFPMRVLRLRGGFGPLQSEPAEGVLTITMEAVPDGTRIVWEYNVGGSMRYEVAKIAPAVDAVMSEALARLRDHLGAHEGGSGETKPAAAAAKPAPEGSEPAG